MLHILKEQIDSVKMEIRGRRAIKQQTTFSCTFRHRQSRDTQARCHLLSQGFHCHQDQILGLWIGLDHRWGGQALASNPMCHSKGVKVSPPKLRAKASRQPESRALLTGTTGTATATSHCPLRPPALLTIPTCTLRRFFHTYKQMETSTEDG